MELDPEELLDALEAHGRRAGLAVHRNRSAMIAALTEASELGAGQPRNEPAALFYTLGRRLSHFGPAAQFFLRSVVRASALANGYELEMSELELAIHCAGIARGELGFVELRGWIAARLRPLGQKGKPSTPKRPR